MPVYATGAIQVYVGFAGAQNAYAGGTAPSPPNTKVPSPAYTPFSGTPSASTANVAFWLGSMEGRPERRTDRSWKNVQNDLASQTPFDFVYAGGEMALMSFMFTKFSNTTAIWLEQMASSMGGALGVANGRIPLNAIGALAGQEGFAIQLWYAYQFGGISNARPSMPDQEGGYHYYQCISRGPDVDRDGSVERARQFIFQAWPKYYPSGQNGFTGGGGGYVLFDNNVTGLPPVPY
jgi:hypothetical protein